MAAPRRICASRPPVDRKRCCVSRALPATIVVSVLSMNNPVQTKKRHGQVQHTFIFGITAYIYMVVAESLVEARYRREEGAFPLKKYINGRSSPYKSALKRSGTEDAKRRPSCILVISPWTRNSYNKRDFAEAATLYAEWCPDRREIAAATAIRWCWETQCPNTRHIFFGPVAMHNPFTLNSLQKGLNFSIAPRHIPVLDTLSSVESAIYKLPAAKQEEFRWTVRTAIISTGPPKPNLSSDELKGTKTLKSDPCILILPTDKGRATVILNKADYDNKITELNATDKYTHLGKDPTATGTDIPVSFDVDNLFTNVPVGETLAIFKTKLEADTTLKDKMSVPIPSIMEMITLCVNATCFQFKDGFYKQADNMQWGLWFSYVDDTFVIWQHGPEILEEFANFFDSLRLSIKFTYETETNGRIPFLDVLITRDNSNLAIKWLDYSTRFPAESLPDFRMWELCRTMSLVGGLSLGSPISPPFNYDTDPYSSASSSSAPKTSIDALALASTQHARRKLSISTVLTPRRRATARFTRAAASGHAGLLQEAVHTANSVRTQRYTYEMNHYELYRDASHESTVYLEAAPIISESRELPAAGTVKCRVRLQEVREAHEVFIVVLMCVCERVVFLSHLPGGTVEWLNRPRVAWGEGREAARDHQWRTAEHSILLFAHTERPPGREMQQPPGEGKENMGPFLPVGAASRITSPAKQEGRLTDVSRISAQSGTGAGESLCSARTQRNATLTHVRGGGARRNPGGSIPACTHISKTRPNLQLYNTYDSTAYMSYRLFGCGVHGNYEAEEKKLRVKYTKISVCVIWTLTGKTLAPINVKVELTEFLQVNGHAALAQDCKAYSFMLKLRTLKNRKQGKVDGTPPPNQQPQNMYPLFGSKLICHSCKQHRHEDEAVTECKVERETGVLRENPSATGKRPCFVSHVQNPCDVICGQPFIGVNLIHVSNDRLKKNVAQFSLKVEHYFLRNITFLHAGGKELPCDTDFRRTKHKRTENCRHIDACRRSSDLSRRLRTLAVKWSVKQQACCGRGGWGVANKTARPCRARVNPRGLNALYSADVSDYPRLAEQRGHMITCITRAFHANNLTIGCSRLTILGHIMLEMTSGTLQSAEQGRITSMRAPWYNLQHRPAGYVCLVDLARDGAVRRPEAGRGNKKVVQSVRHAHLSTCAGTRDAAVRGTRVRRCCLPGRQVEWKPLYFTFHLLASSIHVQDHDGNTVRLAPRSDKTLGECVRVARTAALLLDLGRT
ncbi:hypothetical protein PR048_003052 [Dryococelus australis]|uniref:Reverse transcriptase domain-containing protein n=1 Tax=Dryococelus australis TaxID=614101 RepID=A0ABQ9IM00_9NEOP|nr:hypothetical protein PR048_003052 [Dryococelus australis]